MPATKQSVTVSQPSPGMVKVAVGAESMTFPIQLLHALWDGQRELDFLLIQMYIVLQQAGVNPHTATAAQIKSAIEAQTYWWGN